MTDSEPLTCESIFFFAIHQRISTGMQRPPTKPPSASPKNSHWAARIVAVNDFTVIKEPEKQACAV